MRPSKNEKKKKWINLAHIVGISIVIVVIIWVSFITIKMQKEGKDISGYIVTYLIALGALIISNIIIPLVFRQSEILFKENIIKKINLMNARSKIILKEDIKHFREVSELIKNLENLFLNNALKLATQMEEEKHLKKIILGKLKT